MTSEVKMLPCPFCGGTEIFVEPDEYGSGGQHVAPYHVGCANCKCEQCEDEMSDAIAAWNRRAAPNALAAIEAARVEARAKALEEAAKECDGVYHQNIGPGYGEVRYGVAACAAAIRSLAKEAP